jgi:hypothetical protein
VTRHRHGSLHPTALAALLALAVGAVALPACSHDGEARKAGMADRAPTAERQRVTPPGAEGELAAGPRVRMRLPAHVGLDRTAQAELAAAARRFATTLAGWLYGDRDEIDVEPVALQLRRELAPAPPHIPADQIGSADGQAVDVQVSLQTRRSGVLVVTIRDSRTSYPIPASFEFRAGRWQVIHLNTH